MADTADTADWAELARDAPEIVRLGLARLDATRIAMLGTLRPDGSPRISPIEPYIVNGQLLMGAMTSSQKTADLLRDPRCVLHSVVSGPDSGEGELKLHGSAVKATRGLRDAAAQAWWAARPQTQAVVFMLRIATALFIDWDLDRGLMTVHRWNPQSGYRRSTRSYP